MKRFASFVLFLVGFAAVAAAVVWVRTRSEDAAAQAGRPPYMLPCTLASVRRGRVAPKVRLTGNVRSRENAEIGFEVDGRLALVEVAEAESVSAGQVLARLDAQDAEVQLARSQAAVELAQRQLELLLAGARAEEKQRLEAEVAALESSLELALRELERGRDLENERFISQSQLDLLATTSSAAESYLAAKRAELAEAQAGARAEDVAVARAELAVQQAELARAQIELQKTVLRAPFDGHVVARRASIGDPVAARATVFELVDLAHREIEIEIPARYAARLAPLAPVEVTVDDLPGFALATELDARVPIVDLASGNVRGIVRLEAADDPEARLRPGHFARVLVSLEPLEDALIVPADAVRVLAHGLIVVRAAPAPAPELSAAGAAAPPALSAEWVQVEILGADDEGTAVAVLEGELAEGDRVVVMGADLAFPGAALLPRGDGTAPGGPAAEPSEADEPAALSAAEAPAESDP